jgi:G:T-mismatch repair DNA endonuclease (very short patch repair protein)
LLLIHGVFWRRTTLAALRAALATEPVLMALTERHGLFFLDSRGYFVERPDLAYQPYISFAVLVHGIAFHEESHVLALSLSTVGKHGRNQRTVLIELPRSLDPQQVRKAIGHIEMRLPPR